MKGKSGRLPVRDESDYEWYFRAFFTEVARTVFLIIHDRSRAEDLALRHWRTVATYERPEAWVRRVAIRLAIHELNREGKRKGKEILAQDRRYDQLPDPYVARAVSELAPMQRAAVVLHYWEDQPVREIARVLRVSESTIKQHLHRARIHLAKRLAEEVSSDVD
jgi:RNA polymerase sigma-70 factor (ECF subfamily)